MWSLGKSDGTAIAPEVALRLKLRKIAAKYAQPPHTIAQWPSDTVLFELEMLHYDDIAERTRNNGGEGGGSGTDYEPPDFEDFDPSDYPELAQDDDED